MADDAPEYVGTGSSLGPQGKGEIRNIETNAEGKGGKIVMGKLGSKYVREAWEFSVAGDDEPHAHRLHRLSLRQRRD